ncbi:C25 family peptidase propeptide domain-containing protein, partial [Thermodesulfobacteriota bacterium]
MNNRSRIIAVALALVLVPAIAGARWIELEDSAYRTARIDLLHENASGASISVDLPGFEIVEQDVEGTRYQEISVPGLATTSEVGRPQIPYILVKVALPDIDGVRVRSIDVDYERISGSYHVIPVPEPTTDLSAKVLYSRNTSVYQMDVWYPAKSAELDRPAILRDARFVNLRIYPIRFNPALKALEAARSVEVELDFSGV